MFQIPSDVPGISEVSVRPLGLVGVLLYKILGIGNTFQRFYLSGRVQHLNSLLDKLRRLDIDDERWKFEEVQNYINHCCYTLSIPSVKIRSQEYFNLEQAEAVLLTGKAHPENVQDILHYITIVLQRILTDEVSKGWGMA